MVSFTELFDNNVNFFFKLREICGGAEKFSVQQRREFFKIVLNLLKS